jgi:hypothetical protein
VSNNVHTIIIIIIIDGNCVWNEIFHLRLLYTLQLLFINTDIR